MEMDKRIYVCGPMTGLPKLNYPRFNEVAGKLRKQGFLVNNPAEIKGDETWTWEMYMREALKLMLECEIVLVLNGYEHSRGAMVEIQLAKELGMKVVTEKGVLLNEGKKKMIRKGVACSA